MRWAVHVARMWEKRNCVQDSVGGTEGEANWA
jgi:hypothetical protein